MNLHIDTNWKNIAIAVSGGADSALLSYLVCQKVEELNIQATIHIITNIRGWKLKPWQQYDAEGVYNWLLQRFNNIKFVRHVNFVPPEFEWGDKGPTIVDEYGKLVSGDIIELRAFGEYVCFQNHVDAYFNGVTRNPKNVSFKGMPTRDIDPTEDNKHLLEMEHMGVMVYHPFRFTDKLEIVKMYLSLDLIELFEITRSCEGDDVTRPEVFLGLNFKTYIPRQQVPICGRCFWCKERAWAWENAK
jgi:hypothetical protein